MEDNEIKQTPFRKHYVQCSICGEKIERRMILQKVVCKTCLTKKANKYGREYAKLPRVRARRKELYELKKLSSSYPQ